VANVRAVAALGSPQRVNLSNWSRSGVGWIWKHLNRRIGTERKGPQIKKTQLQKLMVVFTKVVASVLPWIREVSSQGEPESFTKNRAGLRTAMLVWLGPLEREAVCEKLANVNR